MLLYRHVAPVFKKTRNFHSFINSTDLEYSMWSYIYLYIYDFLPKLGITFKSVTLFFNASKYLTVSYMAGGQKCIY